MSFFIVIIRLYYQNIQMKVGITMHIKRLGLYDSREEHDACGIGFYANMNNQRSHDIVLKSLEMLRRLDHRGGIGADGITGDGAGIMTEIPYAFFKHHTSLNLPEEGSYAVGLFFSKGAIKDSLHEAVFRETFESEGLRVIGYRDVPLNTRVLAPHVVETMPYIGQIFIDCSDVITPERKLYLARKQLERYGEEQGLKLYFTSLSRRTIVYKGWLRSDQIKGLFEDLNHHDFTSKFGSVHSRFSTNTFPSWERAHPNRLLMHNGEINTIKGNVNWMRARQRTLLKTVFQEDYHKVDHILDENGSDSSILDNALEFLSLEMPPEKACMLLIPEPWLYNPSNDPSVKAFYEYYSYFMEPWDGPTMISFCNGDKIGALTDRNGLRPGRYTITKQNEIVFSSEVGVIDVDEADVAYKGQLNPGKLLLVDFNQHKVIENNELKCQIAQEKPYETWLNARNQDFDLETIAYESTLSNETATMLQRKFKYTKEEITKYLKPLVEGKKDPIGAMGYDAPLAVFNSRPETLFNYFKQHFAEVTNPPIDAYREKIVTSELTYLGREGNVFEPDERVLERIQLKHPILTLSQLEAIQIVKPSLQYVSICYEKDLEHALEQLSQRVIQKVKHGCDIIVLDDRDVKSEGLYAMPVLLAASFIHQELIRHDLRMHTSIVVVSGDVREVHHIATLIGYGVNAIVPYLAQHTVYEQTLQGHISGNAIENVALFNKTLVDGVIKVMAKMGISTIQSYHGAQIFEAIGLHEDVIERYFTGTMSKISGLKIQDIDAENKRRQTPDSAYLESGSTFQWRQQGQHHIFNPKTIYLLQQACKQNDYALFKAFSKEAHDKASGTIRSQFEFKSCKPVHIDDVEPASEIVKRFKTGAMSYGSISEEAHQTLADAMNDLGGKSNSGEGGEALSRFEVQPDGTNYSSAIKQVASGRFGVTSHYLNHAKEIQIKVAQGAKPGEGGQLPGGKVYPWVAEVRGSTPGIGLISPPPHHDIYSIEDLAQLIHDLKNANRDAKITVKLVSRSGVGTIAAGVAKAYADKIVISGYDGGTGASPKTSIQHAGCPWELGLAETHQTLKLNGLRSRVTLETDGKLLTGRDVLYACLFGAEEFAFATAPLVVLGCIMMRVCHNDTCPVGIATQNQDLRKLFRGRKAHVKRYMYFVAEELREWMAALGVKKLDDLVGRTDLLQPTRESLTGRKTKHLNLQAMLVQTEGPNTCSIAQQHGIEKRFDMTYLYKDAESAIESRTPFKKHYLLNNEQRDVGVLTGSEITKRYGVNGLPEDTIMMTSTGHAGQSLGAYIPRGLTLHHQGDANDYVGKGLSGGKIIVQAPNDARSDNIIVGNVCLYGATKGDVYINGRAGERFCIRNSGANVVVEGVGDHGLEYMTGGRVVILGDVGKNFGQGMSGGVCYVVPSNKAAFIETHQLPTLDFDDVTDEAELRMIKTMLEKHVAYTESKRAQALLAQFDALAVQLVKVIPTDYKLMRHKIHHFEQQGYLLNDATFKAFNDNKLQINAFDRTTSIY